MSLSTSAFDSLEVTVRSIIQDKTKLAREWAALDFNGNGKVSLAEVDRWVTDSYPLLNNKPALMRAFKKTLVDGDGSDWVEKKEFISLLKNLFYFNRLWNVFDEIDTSDDRRIDFAEFSAGVNKVGLNIPAEQLRIEFDTIDANRGGQILFDEFCIWVIGKKIPVD